MNLNLDSFDIDTLAISWDGTETDYTVTYGALRPDYKQSPHPDFDKVDVDVTGYAYEITGLKGPVEYAIEVSSKKVNTTDGCASAKFRTLGTAVYITSIEHYNVNGTGGQKIYGALFHDHTQDCIAATEIQFATCDVNVKFYQAGYPIVDPNVRQYMGSASNMAEVYVGKHYSGNFLTFEAKFDNTTDPCWDGLLDLGNNPALDNVAVNETIDANTDFFMAPANSLSGEFGIVALSTDPNANAAENTANIDMDFYVTTDLFDEFGNNVTDDSGVDQGYPMQNQTFFALQGQLANSSYPLNHRNVACDWEVTISFDQTACPDIREFTGNLEFTDNGDSSFTATSAPGNEIIFFQAKIDSPTVLNGCSEAVIKAATVSVTLTSFY